MNCCGHHSHNGQDTQGGTHKEHISDDTEKKSSWIPWIAAVALIILLIFSLIKV